MTFSLSSKKGSGTQKGGRKSASGNKQRFLVSFVVLSLLFCTVTEAAGSKMMKTFKPTKNLLGVKTKMENVRLPSSFREMKAKGESTITWKVH